jgi:uncharacterized protein (TIGR02996 family)
VLVEFLHALIRLTHDWEDGFVPVLRGSLLLRHWYGDRARPPADVDIECFVRPDTPRDFDPDEPHPFAGEEIYGPVEGRFGRYGEFASRIDLGKAMCRYAASAAEYGWSGSDVGIVFRHDEAPPADGVSLWVYGTPGRRYYAAWEWPGHRPGSGRLQIDLSTPGPYTPDDLGVADEVLVAPGGVTFRAPAYSREAMLATKVSWLVRGLVRTVGGRVAWSGEPKDMFDAHLLATDDALRPDLFRRAMLAVGAADALTWNTLDVLFDVRRVGIADADFGNWAKFARQHPGLAPAGPVALWAELADRLEPLLGDLYPSAEMPFLAAANVRENDKLPLLVYADWLDERGDPRGPVLRSIADTLFPGDADAGRETNHVLAVALDGTSQPWLHQLFGTTARLQSFREAVRVQAAGQCAAPDPTG